MESPFRGPLPPGLKLIETFRWDKSGFVLRERHLERLETSAAFFEIACDARKIERALEEAVRSLIPPQRVRLVLHASGEVETSAAPLGEMKSLSFVIAPERMDSSDPLLHHKTTRRARYDSALAAAKAAGAGEAVFLNERGELTEGSFTNLFVERGGVLLTPALSCGLLPGTLRADLIAQGRAQEAVLTPDDLDKADAIYLGNSVRGLVRAEWLRNTPLP